MWIGGFSCCVQYFKIILGLIDLSVFTWSFLSIYQLFAYWKFLFSFPGIYLPWNLHFSTTYCSKSIIKQLSVFNNLLCENLKKEASAFIPVNPLAGRFHVDPSQNITSNPPQLPCCCQAQPELLPHLNSRGQT